MRFLLFTSVCLLSCGSIRDGLQPVQRSADCVSDLKPRFETTWYTASIDVVGKHLSGLLLVKQTDESSRIVFTSEAGITLFDFEFNKAGFAVHRVIPQLNRKPVIETLRKDFELMLLNLPLDNLLSYTRNSVPVYLLEQRKEVVQIETDSSCTSISKVILGSKQKVKTIITFTRNNPPEVVTIRHHNFNMETLLNRINR